MNETAAETNFAEAQGVPTTVQVVEAAATAAETIISDVKTAGNTTISRLKSWPMWLGILGAIWMLLSALGIPAKIGITSDTYNSAIGAAGAVLVALGVVNNPTTAGLTTKD